MAHRCNHCQATCLGYPSREPEPSLDIARLLATNDPPSDDQEKEFRRIRTDGVKRLADLETIIEELQQTLEGVIVERDALAWKVEHHRLVLNPVRRLPADILREIFLFACARSSEQPSHFYLTPPTFLSAVCRLWNHIVLTFPQLWRQCKFVLPYEDMSFGEYLGYDTVPKGYTADNAYWLSGVSISRAAVCPLWLHLHLDDNLSYSSLAYPFLLCISSRIQRLRVTTDNLGLLGRPEFRYFVNGLTALVETDLCTSSNGDTTFGALSLPRTVQHLIITPYAAFSNPEVDFNWSHLESLVLRARFLGHGDISIPSTLIILAKVHNLHHLTFSADADSGFAAADVGPGATDGLITLAHLTDLVIESSTLSFCDVIANISTPSLERLVIKGGSPEILPRIEEMLQKSGCTLRHLTLQSLRDEHGSVNAADSLIRRCGLLRELSLLGIHTGTELITRFLSPLKSLPYLCVLTLDISYVPNFPVTSHIGEGILAFLESRRRLIDVPSASVVDMESFTLHAPPQEVFDFTESQHQRIRELRASGLLFYICRYDNNDPRMY